MRTVRIFSSSILAAGSPASSTILLAIRRTSRKAAPSGVRQAEKRAFMVFSSPARGTARGLPVTCLLFPAPH